jgi:dTDP-4-amino-4,6-dideoxygalactose transaminase
MIPTLPNADPVRPDVASVGPADRPHTRKVVRTPADLAINGACPAFEMPLHVGRPWSPGRERFRALVDDMFERNWLTNDGPLVRQFERELCDYLRVRHCIATSSGTTAIEVAIRALGMSGEVIVPAYTFIATAHAVSWLGLRPVFADIDPISHQVDPDAVRRLVTARTGGILAVNLWGGCAPVQDLERIADECGVPLLFDSAHGFGTEIGGRPLGGGGSAETFSFHATKCLHTFEGGAISTNDDALAERMRHARAFGIVEEGRTAGAGTNAKMSEVCAAMGIANLRHIGPTLEATGRAFAHYRQRLKDVPGIRLHDPSAGCRPNWQYVIIEVDPDCGCARDGLLQSLHAEGVLARRYFWPGCHRMQPYVGRGEHSPHPLAAVDEVAARVIALPTGPSIAPADIDVVCDIIRMMARG